MKNKILYITLATLVAACSSPDKKTELEKLKKQKSEIEAKITSLQEEISKTDTTANKEKVIEVIARPVTSEIFKTYIEVQGKIDADENVSLSSEMPGTVVKIDVKVGDEVVKGQVLAETDARALMQSISDLQTNAELVNQLYEKQKALWDQKIGTEVQFIQIRSQKESMEKKMSTLQEQLKMTKIISPINGTVDGVNIKIGQAIAPGMPSISVINFSNLKVKADVAESYASRIKSGNEALVLFPDTKDSVVSKIHYAARGINALTRTFMVEVLLDNNKEYHPNMVAKLKINDYQSPKPQVTIPVKFIQRGTEENYVFLAENNIVIRKVIKTGREYQGIVEVTEGLSEGDLLITDGYDLVIEGDKVAVRK